MILAAWPSITTNPPGFWDAFRRPTVPASAPAVRPASLSGIAARFDVEHVPAVRNLNGSGTWGGRTVRILPAAFDRSLARVRAGKHAVELRVDHTDRALATTKDKSLMLWREGGVLRFSVNAAMRAGRRAIRWTKANRQYRWASIACETVGLIDPSGTLLVVEAVLNEISLTPRPSCPGTRVTVT
jgi:hypothetical protein